MILKAKSVESFWQRDGQFEKEVKTPKGKQG
jgi:hypothetical protein